MTLMTWKEAPYRASKQRQIYYARDPDLEDAIDAVGRDRVFGRAYELWWRRDAPPKTVWWGIVNELKARDA